MRDGRAEPRAPYLTPGSKPSLAADVGSNSPSARRGTVVHGHAMIVHPTQFTRVFTISLGLVLTIAAYNTSAAGKNSVDPFPFQFLYEQCENQSTFCYAYISGVADMMWLNGQVSTARELSLCNPEGESRKAITQAVVNYGQQHPEKWADDMVMTTALALRQTWPCP